MDRVEFKKEFIEDLKFFNKKANGYLKQGYTIEQVEDIMVKCVSSFYGSLMSVDDYAPNKAYFVITFVYQIIKGNIDEIEINALCDEIEEEKIRVA